MNYDIVYEQESGDIRCVSSKKLDWKYPFITITDPVLAVRVDNNKDVYKVKDKNLEVRNDVLGDMNTVLYDKRIYIPGEIEVQIKYEQYSSDLDMTLNTILREVTEDEMSEYLMRLEIELNRAKAIKGDEIHIDCSKAITAGFYIDELYYQSEAHDQDNLKDTYNAAFAIQMGVISGVDTVPYETGLRDGHHRPHTPEEIFNIYSAWLTHKSNCIARAVICKEALMVADSIEAIEKISYYENTVL